jgi:hypothetical protein
MVRSSTWTKDGGRRLSASRCQAWGCRTCDESDATLTRAPWLRRWRGQLFAGDEPRVTRYSNLMGRRPPAAVVAAPPPASSRLVIDRTTSWRSLRWPLAAEFDT